MARVEEKLAHVSLNTEACVSSYVANELSLGPAIVLPVPRLPRLCSPHRFRARICLSKQMACSQQQ